jgi:hypothetical protein
MNARAPLSRKTAIKSIFYGQWAYWATVMMAIWASLYMPAGEVRTTLILTPILPGLLNISIAGLAVQRL